MMLQNILAVDPQPLPPYCNVPMGGCMEEKCEMGQGLCGTEGQEVQEQRQRKLERRRYP